jgi:hypothetical protein
VHLSLEGMRGGELGGALLKVELELLLGERLLALDLKLCGPLLKVLLVICLEEFLSCGWHLHLRFYRPSCRLLADLLVGMR